MDYAGTTEQTLNLSFYPFLWQAGGSVFTEDGTDIAFDSQEGISALEFLVDLKKAGGLPADAATASIAVEGSPWAAGKVDIHTNGLPGEIEPLRAPSRTPLWRWACRSRTRNRWHSATRA